MPYINIQGSRLFYEEYGAGFPLLFGHSYLWDRNQWAPQIKHLKQYYRCIVPDLWGHGRSELLPEMPYSIEALADDFWLFTRELKLDRFAIIGLSVGGMWGARLALNYPDFVKALVLINTYTGEEPPEKQKYYFDMLELIDLTGKISPAIIQRVTGLFFSSTTSRDNPALIEHFQNNLSTISPARLPSLIALGKAIFSRNPMLSQLKMLVSLPTLLVAAEDDVSRPPHESEEMAERIENARLEIVPNAGHTSNLEQPEFLNRLLKTFLEDTLENTVS